MLLCGGLSLILVLALFFVFSFVDFGDSPFLGGVLCRIFGFWSLRRINLFLTSMI